MKRNLIAIALAMAMSAATANVVTFANEFSGSGGICTGPNGCVSLEITDIGGGVRFKLDGTMVNSEFITSLYGNGPGGLLMANASGDTDTVEAFQSGTDAFKADGDGFFDWKIDFYSGPASARFNGIDSLTWDFVGSFTAQDFLDDLSVNGPVGKTGFSFAVHAQGLTTGSGSGWFYGVPGDEPPPPPPPPPPPGSLPEPTSLALVGLACLSMGLVRRNRK